jgi:hypothetical protein
MRIAVALFITGLVAAGFFWRKADAAAVDRVEWLSDSISSEDDTTGISLSATGFLHRDVMVSAYVLGDEDKSTEDFWVEDIAHGAPAREFYAHGFRRIVTYSNGISRTIIIAPPAAILNEPQVAASY